MSVSALFNIQVQPVPGDKGSWNHTGTIWRFPRLIKPSGETAPAISTHTIKHEPAAAFIWSLISSTTEWSVWVRERRQSKPGEMPNPDLHVAAEKV